MYNISAIKLIPQTSTIIALLLFIISPVTLAQGGFATESIMTGTTTLVSVASDGTQANDRADRPSISADGSMVAFGARATNLVPDDNNGYLDVFVHDRQTGQTTLVSVASDGTQGNADSRFPVISADGSSVAFLSDANTLVPETGSSLHVFVHDLKTGQTTKATLDSDGRGGNYHTNSPRGFDISASGRYVAFESRSAMVENDTNGLVDIFVRDRQTSTTTRISESADGTEGNSDSFSPVISDDGRYVAFESRASNLLTGVSDDLDHIYLHDRQTGKNTLVSRASNGVRGNAASLNPSISGDGFTVAFYSLASNLVDDDTNDKADLFVHDLMTHITTLVSVDSDGAQGDEDSGDLSSLSAGGRYVLFNSFATNMVPDDINRRVDVFVHDRQTAATSRVSEATDGTPGNFSSGNFGLDISASGHAATFSSSASNLVSADASNAEDVLVRIFDIPGPPPGRPFGIRATDGTFSDRVGITWHSVLDATVYRVFRCLTAGQTCGSPIGYAKTNSFDDTNGTPGTVYYYRVRACNETGCSPFSVADRGFLSNAPAKPTMIRATDGAFSDRVRITWEEVTGATLYRVFRCLTIGQTCGSPIGFPKTGTFDDKKAIPGTVYYYRVRACNLTTCGLFSVANTGFSTNAPARPTGIRASDGTFKDRVHVTFNPVEGATVYRVFRCLTTGQTCGLPIAYPKTGVFDDRKGDVGTVYYYRVRACTSGICSLFSVANAGHR